MTDLVFTPESLGGIFVDAPVVPEAGKRLSEEVGYLFHTEDRAPLSGLKPGCAPAPGKISCWKHLRNETNRVCWEEMMRRMMEGSDERWMTAVIQMLLHEAGKETPEVEEHRYLHTTQMAGYMFFYTMGVNDRETTARFLACETYRAYHPYDTARPASYGFSNVPCNRCSNDHTTCQWGDHYEGVREGICTFLHQSRSRTTLNPFAQALNSETVNDALHRAAQMAGRVFSGELTSEKRPLKTWAKVVRRVTPVLRSLALNKEMFDSAWNLYIALQWLAMSQRTHFSYVQVEPWAEGSCLHGLLSPRSEVEFMTCDLLQFVRSVMYARTGVADAVRLFHQTPKAEAELREQRGRQALAQYTEVWSGWMREVGVAQEPAQETDSAPAPAASAPAPEGAEEVAQEEEGTEEGVELRRKGREVRQTERSAESRRQRQCQRK